MANPSNAVALDHADDGTWNARVIAVPELSAEGQTSNEALATLWTQFNDWLTHQRTDSRDLSVEQRGEIWNKVFWSIHSLYISTPTSVPGDFYVDSDCCASCGVPQSVAPDLVGWTEEPFVSCYWKKQPKTAGEFQQAYKIFQNQELGCHRYAGSDPLIQMRVGYGNCDGAALAGVSPPDLPAVFSEQWGSSENDKSHITPPPKSLWEKVLGRR